MLERLSIVGFSLQVSMTINSRVFVGVSGAACNPGPSLGMAASGRVNVTNTEIEVSDVVTGKANVLNEPDNYCVCVPVGHVAGGVWTTSQPCTCS